MNVAFCPKCKGAMGAKDITCANCGYDFPRDPPPADLDFIGRQFDIRFLLYLMGLTAFICGVYPYLGRHGAMLAPPMAISGLLIWRSRKVRYAALPGLAIGFAIGVALTLSNDLHERLGGGVWIATGVGCPLNVWLKGFPKSGCLAIILGYAAMIFWAWIFSPR